MAKNEAVFTKDLENRKLTVVRSFHAPVDRVWEAWTTAEILDQWWAPKPYKAVTKSLDFRPGGRWLYAMTAPDGKKDWCRANYQTIHEKKSITSTDMFCDEEGNKIDTMPEMHWINTFIPGDNKTTVTTEITYDKTADMETILQMGFQEGYTMGLNNLEEYLAGK